MLTDIKLSKVQMSKIIKLCGLFGSCIDNLWMKALTNFAISLARDNLSRSIRNLASNEKNITGK